MTLSRPEIKLAKDCAAGDRQAQKALYDAFCNELMIVCLRYIPNAEDAREALMDGFLQGFKNIGRYEHRGDGSLKAWLKKIMVNTCLMHLRKKALPVAEELSADITIGVDDDFIAAMSAKEIMLQIQRLPQGYRTVFNLFYFEEMTHREIAQQLGISENTSKSQLAKAKTALRQMIVARY